VHQPDAFAPKHRWAMDWYYPVLTGVVGGAEGRARLSDRFDTFVMDGRTTPPMVMVVAPHLELRFGRDCSAT